MSELLRSELPRYRNYVDIGTLEFSELRRYRNSLDVRTSSMSELLRYRRALRTAEVRGIRFVKQTETTRPLAEPDITYNSTY